MRLRRLWPSTSTSSPPRAGSKTASPSRGTPSRPPPSPPTWTRRRPPRRAAAARGGGGRSTGGTGLRGCRPGPGLRTGGRGSMRSSASTRWRGTWTGRGGRGRGRRRGRGGRRTWRQRSRAYTLRPHHRPAPGRPRPRLRGAREGLHGCPRPQRRGARVIWHFFLASRAEAAESSSAPRGSMGTSLEGISLVKLPGRMAFYQIIYNMDLCTAELAGSMGR
mmetsp:Transcript_46296/g.148251  ORF Transcript_46296/g.148251 Transcript_46296/m.148251 type:complete len:220 (+) Transcript_46296:581-1240(+)